MKKPIVAKDWQKHKSTAMMIAFLLGLFIFLIGIGSGVELLSTEVYAADTTYSASAPGISLMAATGIDEDIKNEIDERTKTLKAFYNTVMLSLGFSIIGAVAVYHGVKVGLTFMSADDAETKKKAKMQLFTLIIGVVIAVCAMGILVPAIDSLATIFGTSPIK